jgi:hypothetical protein
MQVHIHSFIQLFIHSLQHAKDVKAEAAAALKAASAAERAKRENAKLKERRAAKAQRTKEKSARRAAVRRAMPMCFNLFFCCCCFDFVNVRSAIRIKSRLAAIRSATVAMCFIFSIFVAVVVLML